MSTTPTSPPGVWRSWGWSIGLHAVVVVLVALGVMSWRDSEPVAQRLAIEAHVVSAAPSRAAQPPPPVVEPKPEPLPEPEVEPQPDPVKIARDIAQAEAVAKQKDEQRILAQKAEDARLQQVREQEEKERATRENAEKERARREKEQNEKAAREQAALDKQRQQREAELNAQIAAEERLAAARASGKMDQYVAQITARIESRWIRPQGARPGLDCEVRVTQVPGGAVVSARVTRCNGDDAVRASIEAAVLRASPLPLPADAALFERNLVVTFRPED